MFWFKKIVALFISPLGLLLVLLAAGLILAWRNIGGQWPKRVVVFSSIALALVCCGPTGQLLLAPLENPHSPLTEAPEVEHFPGTPHVVVLGGGYRYRVDGPVTSELTPASIVRLNEGIRIHRALDDSVLIVSGAAVGQPGSTGEAMAELATAMGVPKSEILIADSPRDTAEEARAVHKLTEPDDPILVVTSASHMTRSLKLFERNGIDAIAAPTHHLTTTTSLRIGNLWPSAANVRRVERAVYEYTALLWISLGGS